MDVANLPLDSVFLTPDKKTRILDILENIQQEYRVQAQKVEWQSQLLEAKQRLIDKYEAMGAQGTTKAAQHGTPLTLEIAKSYTSEDGITESHDSPTMTNVTELSSTHCMESSDATATSTHGGLPSPSMTLVQHVQQLLVRFPQDDAFRHHTEQLCVVVSKVPVLRRALRTLHDQAQWNAAVVDELRHEHGTNLVHLHHKRQFQRVLQADMVRLRTQCSDLHATMAAERRAASDLQVECSNLQEDYMELDQENHQLRGIVAQFEKNHANLRRKCQQVAAINQQTNERLGMQHEDLANQRHRAQDTIRTLQTSVESMAANPLWLEFLRDRHMYIDLQGEMEGHVETLQSQLQQLTRERSRLERQHADQQHTIEELKRVLRAQETKWTDQSSRLMQLVDSQEEALAELRQSAAAMQKQHVDMERKSQDMEQLVASLQASNDSLVTMVADHVVQLKRAKKDLHRRFLECESLKVQREALQVERCELSDRCVAHANSMQEQVERWHKTSVELEQRHISLATQLQLSQDEVHVLRQHALPDLSPLFTAQSTPSAPLTLDDSVLQKIQQVLDCRIQDYQRDLDKYPSNAALKHFLSVESVFLAALRGRLLLLA
ncbi:hypothetical protein DYB34_007880 [Aphanomyces astaci]|uniref:Uncharacterized protein n=1 Tax=Aphanomyces astaci TaxID=112090 RepID=A0A3R7DMY9_APHAT|nr:hypothetical protein DYB34_007880 [Aphanomyces astaci]